MTHSYLQSTIKLLNRESSLINADPHNPGQVKTPLSPPQLAAYLHVPPGQRLGLPGLGELPAALELDVSTLLGQLLRLFGQAVIKISTGVGAIGGPQQHGRFCGWPNPFRRARSTIHPG